MDRYIESEQQIPGLKPGIWCLDITGLIYSVLALDSWPEARRLVLGHQWAGIYRVLAKDS